MTVDDAFAFVTEHGVVLVSAQGPVPRLTEAIAGEPIKGSWWGHPKGHQIFAILEALSASENILVCRLVDGKVTLVHRRLWPALFRVANRFAPDRIAQVIQEHTAAGRHVNRDIPFPQWVPLDVKEQARKLSEDEALVALGPWVRTRDTSRHRGRRKE
jgi:hypothetical protein